MKKHILTIIIICCTSLITLAQTHKATIYGMVTDDKAEPVIGVAVVLQTIDSVYIGVTTTDIDGRFKFDSKTRPYRLLIQHLTYHNLTIESSKDSLGTIILKENSNQLAAVVVKADRSILKVEDGKLAYNIKQLAADKVADNAFDILKELPGVIEQNDVIRLTGAAGSTAIVINGKATTMTISQLTDYLKSMPLDRVEKAEIVYNAPPQWHVKGAAINIVLKKRDTYTLQGQVQGKWENQHASTYSGGGSLYLSTPKISFDLTYNYSDKESKLRTDLFSHHTVKGEIYDISSSVDEKNTSSFHNVYTGLEYNISEKSSISMNYVGQFTPRKENESESKSSYFSNAKSLNNGDNYMHNLQLAYKSPFGLDLGVHYTSYNSDMLQSMQYYKNDVYSDAFFYNQYQSINKLNIYADMAHSLSKGWKLTYGAKYSYIDNANRQIYKETAKNSDKDYDITSGTYETTADAYVGISKTFLENKLSVDLSLTGEYYKINDYSRSNFLPSATITYVPVEKHVLQFSYLSYKTYPSYWTLQDYVSYNDEYSVSYGNPTLRPSLTSSANLIYVYKSKYMFQVSYYMANDFFFIQSYQSPDELKLISKTTNSNYCANLDFTAVIPFSIGKVLSTNLTLSAYSERYKNDDWFGIAYNRNKWSVLLMANNTVRISEKPKISLNIVASYCTPRMQGIMDLGQMWCIDAGAKWTFNKNKCVLSFQCNDMFESQYSSIKVRYANQYQDMDQNFYFRKFAVGFTYKFKGYKERNKGNVDVSRFGAGK
ncbi:MAG: outer membrane beta-barrel protein [Bacteroidales bacterium]